MASLVLINKKISLLDAHIQRCEHYKDTAGAEMAYGHRRRLLHQKAIIEEYVQTLGTVGTFDEESAADAQEIAHRRKRSAVVIGDVTKLPLIARDKIAFPNVFLRSSLFGIWSPRKAGPPLRDALIPCENGYDIVYQGPSLWQKDFLLMAMLLKMSGENLGATVTMTLGQILKVMKLHDGVANYEALMSSLARLGGARLLVTNRDGDVEFDGPLICCEFTAPGQVRAVKYQVNVQWGNLFGVARWTALPFDELKGLQRKEFAIWLASYLVTHDGKRPVTLDRLHELSGKTTETLYFRRTLKEALADCLSVGLLQDGGLTKDDLVVFTPKRKFG